MAAPSVLNQFRLLLLSALLTIISAGIFDDENELKTVQLNLSLTTEYSVAKPQDLYKKKLTIFCNPGQVKKLYRLWANPKISIYFSGQDADYDVYIGDSEQDVVDLSKTGSYLRWPSAFIRLKQEYSFPPFNSSCVGILSSSNYTVKYMVKNSEPWYIVYTVLGLLVFFTAASSSRNIYLHYGTGVSLGVFTSFLLIVFIVNKFLPQKLKILGYAVGVLSTSISMFALRYLTDRIHHVVMNYWQILLGYICLSGLISFFIVYRYGPVSNPRTLDLIRWSLQLMGLTLVYHGTQIAETSIAIILLALIIYNFPVSVCQWLRKLRYRYFPQKVRFLTAEEYFEEKERATKESLEALRDYCQSPDCNTWRTVSRLSSPSRFASFIEGDRHISEQELTLYDSNRGTFPRHREEDSSSDGESDLSYVMEVIAKRHPD